MSLKKVEQVKKDKGFRIFDLVIYGVVVLLVAVLFIVVFTTGDKSPLSGIQIKVLNDVVYEYDFEEGELSRNKEVVEITEETSDKIILKVNTGGNGYNVVEIDKHGSVKVTEANCGMHKECVNYMQPIKDNASTPIVCLPHALTILPAQYDIDDGNVTI